MPTPSSDTTGPALESFPVEDQAVHAAPAGELAIFGHDGVLMDSLECHQEAWFELQRRTALGLTPEFLHATFGMTNPSMLRRLRGDAITEAEIRRYSDLKEECYRAVARGRIHTDGRGPRGPGRADGARGEAGDRLQRTAG